MTKEAEGGMEKGASDHTGNSITVNIVWQKKKSCKEKSKGNTSSSTVRGTPGLELASAAGVALQEAHYGRVALGPSDEFFQGEFSVSVGVHLAEDLFCPLLWG